MSRSANDDRSDSMNPNNDAYYDSLDNHSNQLNPNNDAYQGPEENEDQDWSPLPPYFDGRLLIHSAADVPHALWVTIFNF